MDAGLKTGCSVFLLAAAAAGQQPAPAGDVVIRSTTTLVEVRVMATDSKGHAVTDLRREDFRIFDNSELQDLRLFAVYGGPHSSLTGADGKPDQPEATEPEYAFVLLDWLNCDHDARVRVCDCLAKMLRESKPLQKIAIYVQSRAPFLLHDFTNDRLLLAGLVEHMDLTDRPLPRPKIISAEDRVKFTMQTLSLMADYMRPLPGRKSIIWPTRGIALMVGGGGGPAALFFQDMEKALAKLNGADVGVYAIDVGGLQFVPNRLFEDAWEFSNRTGASAFVNRNDLDVGMRQALEDPVRSYTLGFYAQESPRKGLHVIKVRVGRPGVKLRYRETYDPSAVGR